MLFTGVISDVTCELITLASLVTSRAS